MRAANCEPAYSIIRKLGGEDVVPLVQEVERRDDDERQTAGADVLQRQRIDRRRRF